MKTNIHLRSYFIQNFLGWEMFPTKVVEKINNTLFMFSYFILR
jgi:hypothetical protein